MEPFRGSPLEWNTLITGLPDPHLLQTWEWSQVKAAFGWQPHPVVWTDAGQIRAAGMLLRRRVPMQGFAARLSLVYIPKGPLLDWEDAGLRKSVLDDLRAYAKRQGAIFLKMDPDVELGWGVPGSQTAREEPFGRLLQSELQGRGWRYSPEQIQFRNTVLVDLSLTEEQLLGSMKQKTRYNVRLAERKGVRIRPGFESDFPLLYRMYAETAARDGFVIRDEAYYQMVWGTFMSSKSAGCTPLIAEVEGSPVGAVFLFHFSGRTYYLYGMSRDNHREKMPNYLLQWEAIRSAKAAGSSWYDLWGAPEIFDATDDMWGVYRFKEGLGGQVRRTLGAWDYPARPVLYSVYTELLPRILNVLRARSMARTRKSAGV
jgi:peptidoglycan pentaglycine glycine transferase (the first glycine)